MEIISISPNYRMTYLWGFLVLSAANSTNHGWSFTHCFLLFKRKLWDCTSKQAFLYSQFVNFSGSSMAVIHSNYEFTLLINYFPA